MPYFFINFPKFTRTCNIASMGVPLIFKTLSVGSLYA